MNIFFNLNIDLDSPICWYCNLYLQHAYGGGNISIYNDIYNCKCCNENYRIYYFNDQIKRTIFTCIDLLINLDVEKNQYGIKYNDDNDKYTWIPPFNIDFSDKQLLNNKFKTYLIFS